MENNTGKIIVADWGCLMFSAIFAHKFTPQIPVTYTILNMLFANILKVGMNEGDEVFIAVDYGHSWRKDFDAQYKATRKEGREKHKDIDWDTTFKEVNVLLDSIDRALPFQVLKVQHLEADDWMSFIPRYYPNKKVVLISFDSDLHQLLTFPNVAIFSPKSKKYKVGINPYKELAKKINKEATDGLTNPVLNESDFEKRNMIVNLLELPEFVENQMRTVLDNLPLKGEDIFVLPFQAMREKYFKLITDKSKLVTIEKCEKQLERKTKKKKAVKK
jgi:hypothetical protein